MDDELDIEFTGIQLERFESVWFGLNKLNNRWVNSKLPL